MKMKRLAAFLLAALMLLSLAACGSNGGTGDDAALNGFGDLPGDGGEGYAEEELRLLRRGNHARFLAVRVRLRHAGGPAGRPRPRSAGL